jgi:hypothetical protein
MLKDFNSVGGADDATFGWGGTLSGKMPLFGKDDVRFMFSGGRGTGRYLGLSTLGDAVVNSSNKLQSVWVFDGFAAYRHAWNEEWRSNVIVSGISGVSLGDYLGGTATRGTASAAANLLYSPVAKLTLGGEFRFASRTEVAGNSGNLSRFQVSAKYYF